MWWHAHFVHTFRHGFCGSMPAIFEGITYASAGIKKTATASPSSSAAA
jgi:hypothetical protein